MAERSLFPELARLHERHRGLTQPLAEAYGEAAAVCLGRHGTPPAHITVHSPNTGKGTYEITWPTVTPRQQAAWANRDDATRDGAYGVALAAAECHLGLVSLARARVKSGSDYLVGSPGSEIGGDDGQLDLEMARRLEVSGIDRCESEADFLYRLGRKVEQTRKPGTGGLAMAGVVAFNLRRVGFRDA